VANIAAEAAPLGVHVSIAGGVSRAVERAEALGCSAFQIFCRNPRSWKTVDLDGDEAELFRRRVGAAGMGPVVVHTSYLINLASPEAELLEKSVGLLAWELAASAELGADYLVLHPGSHRDGDRASAPGRIASSLGRAMEGAEGLMKGRGAPEGTAFALPTVLFENTAGGGSHYGSRLEEVGELIALADDAGLECGLCFDTCHAFAAGYPEEGGGDGLAGAIEAGTGLASLRLVHLNDSKTPKGSGVDRHQHIGSGEIGPRLLGDFLRHESLRGVPVILETPKKGGDADDLMNLDTVRKLWRKR